MNARTAAANRPTFIDRGDKRGLSAQEGVEEVVEIAVDLPFGFAFFLVLLNEVDGRLIVKYGCEESGDLQGGELEAWMGREAERYRMELVEFQKEAVGDIRQFLPERARVIHGLVRCERARSSVRCHLHNKKRKREKTLTAYTRMCSSTSSRASSFQSMP